MKRLCYTLLVFILLSSLSCTKSTVTSAFDHAAEIMNEKPDSAKLVLDGIRRSELRTRATRARFALLYSQAMDKCYIDTDNDSLISVALKYYTKHGTDHDKALAYYYQSVVLRNAGNVEAEIKALVSAQKYVEDTNDEYLQAMIYHVLANKYFLQMSYDDALALYKKSAEIYTKLDKKHNALYAYEGCRSVLSITKDYQQAINFGEIAIKLADELGLVERIIPIKINTYVHNSNRTANDLKQIKHLLTIKKDYLDNEQYRYWGIIYENEQKLDSALYNYKTYIQDINKHTHASLGVMLNISKLAESNGDLNTALKYERLYSDNSQLLYKDERETLIKDLEKKYKTKQIEESYLTLCKQHKLIIIIYSLIVIIVFFIVIYAIHKYKAKINRKQCEYKMYVAQYETQHSLLQKQYNSLLNTIGVYTKENGEQGFKLVEALQSRLESIRTLAEYAYLYGEKSPHKFYSKFQEQMAISRRKNDNLSKEILEIADMLNNGFISYLKKQYPSMTMYDLAYCGLILLGFTHDSIRVIYNHTNIQSLYIIRSRIRTKMNIDKRLCLEEHILNMCKELEDN